MRLDNLMRVTVVLFSKIHLHLLDCLDAVYPTMTTASDVTVMDLWSYRYLHEPLLAGAALASREISPEASYTQCDY